MKLNGIESLCLTLQSLKLSITNLAAHNLLAYSESQISLAVSETLHAHFIDQYLQENVIFNFIVPDDKLGDYDSNQTKCMGRADNYWSEDFCETRVDTRKVD